MGRSRAFVAAIGRLPVRMTFHHPQEEDPLTLGGTPEEEGISEADVAERLGLDPEEQENFTEKHGQRTQVNQPEPDGNPETGPDDREESVELDAPKYDDA